MRGGGGGGGGAVGQLSNCHGERTFLYVGYKEDCYKHISNSLVWWGMVHVRSVALTSCLHGRVACRNDPCEFSIHVKLYVSNHTIYLPNVVASAPFMVHRFCMCIVVLTYLG